MSREQIEVIHREMQLAGMRIDPVVTTDGNLCMVRITDSTGAMLIIRANNDRLDVFRSVNGNEGL